MKFRTIGATILVSFVSAAALADERVTICESDSTGTQARIEFRFHRPGQYEALEMEYQGRNVMSDPLSIFNHTGFILFRATNGIEFNAAEYSDEFNVTVPAFGGQPVVTVRGKCRLKE